MKKKILSLEEKIEVGRKGSEMYRHCKKIGKGGWESVAKELGVTHTTAKRYILLWEEGGAEAIEEAHQCGRLRRNYSNSEKLIMIGNTRDSLWFPEFKYSDIWNQVLFNRDISNLINGRV